MWKHEIKGKRFRFFFRNFLQTPHLRSVPLPLSEDNEMKTDDSGASSLSDSCKSSAVWMSAPL